MNCGKDKAMDKVSVIIPVYKVELYIRQCLDSVVNQTYKNLEIIIIDDGSPDSCGAICDEYARSDARVSVVHKVNGGLCAARNDGIRMATGDWLTFVDSDDWLELDYFENMVGSLSQKKPDVLCVTGGYLNGKQQSIRRIFYTPQIWNAGDDKTLLIAKVLTGQAGIIKKRKNERPARLCTAWDKICKTSFIKEKGIFFDEQDKAYEDIWFSLLVMTQADVVACCDCIGYHYRMVEYSITKGYNPTKADIAHANLNKIMLLFSENKNKIVHSAIFAYGFDIFINSLLCSALHPMDKRNYREKAIEIQKIKDMPRFREVLQSYDNCFLVTRNKIKKIIFRFPGAWQIILIYSVKRKVEAIKQWLLERR